MLAPCQQTSTQVLVRSAPSDTWWGSVSASLLTNVVYIPGHCYTKVAYVPGLCYMYCQYRSPAMDMSKHIPNTQGSTMHTRNVALKGPAKLIDSRKRKNG